MFQMPEYREPDFTQEKFVNAPDAMWEKVTIQGVAPENYHSTSMYPEYFKIAGKWTLAKESRMDSSVVLCDDGPLPDVYGNVYEGQDAMRGLVRKATTIVCMASTLHTVATGNMTPSYRVVDGQVRPLYFYSVDISEFAVNKLLDRGSLTVKTIVTNVQDFIIQVRRGVCS